MNTPPIKTSLIKTRLRRLLAGGAATAALLLVSAAGAQADDATISNVERTADGFNVLIDVPAGSDVDLSGVSVTVDGQATDSTAQLANRSTSLERTTVLAIDTSNSMRGDRFDAARKAANAFLDAAPDNVLVGVVTFDGDVDEALAPTTNRKAARSVIKGLKLDLGTKLYDGIASAAALTGASGSRSVLVISDGANTGPTPISTATDALDGGDIVVDIVALNQTTTNLAKLQQIAGNAGVVIDGGPDSVTQNFADQAAALQRQVSVVISAPGDLSAGQPTVAVTLPTADGLELVARATVSTGGNAAPAEGVGAIPVAEPPSAASAPIWYLYAGAAVFGVALIAAFVLLVPRRAPAMTPAERVTTYTTDGRGRELDRPENEDALASAKQAMAGVLARNKSLEARITLRLDAAGSALKSSEWLLVHTAVFVLSAAVGLLLGRGNIIIGLIFLILGAVGPWMYLGIRRNRRRKAFNAALPDTLQLMSGSLSAGLSLAQSVDTIVREGTEPVASEFKRVLIETRLGIPLEDAFDGVASRFDSKDFAWAVMAIRIQRQVGGNLGELLDTVAATMRERDYMRRQVDTLAAEGKISAYVLGGLPPAFLLYLFLANRDYVMPLFTDPRGWAMLVGMGLLLGLGIFWMSRLIKVEV